MTKIVDDNGFWLIKDNPISKEGVFPYLGETISSELEPKKIYYVYRPASELSSEETIQSFNAVPFSDEHEMLGDGFTPYDDKPASGVLFNTYSKDGEMYGDLKIFSESLKDEIANGKKELSLGYLCEYELKKGVWNGQPYDAIQKNLRGNHIALVERGRMGSDVRVYDKAITMDKLDIVIDNDIPSGDGSPKESGEAVSPSVGENQMVDKKTMDADKREAIREIMAIAAKPDSDFQGGEEEKIETIAKLLEKSEYSKSEAGTANDEEPKKEGEDKCGKDEDETKEEEKKAEDESEEEEKKDTEDEDDGEEKKDTEDEEEKEDDKKSAEDSAKAVLKELDARASLKKELEPHIGSFACDGMTAKEIAAYGCKKLGLQATADEAQAVLRGFFAAHSKDNKVFGLDSAPVAKATGLDKSIQKYLND